MRQELDKQMAEKADRARANKEEDDIYTKLQEEHVKLLAMRELEKKDLARIKTQQEKESPNEVETSMGLSPLNVLFIHRQNGLA